MRKLFCISATILSVLLLIGTACAQTDIFLKEIVEVLERKIMHARDELAENPLIIKMVKEYNKKNKDVTLSEINNLDQIWIAGEMEKFCEEFIVNVCGQRLLDFQDEHEGYAEIFVTDERGLIVGMTNRTSDYY